MNMAPIPSFEIFFHKSESAWWQALLSIQWQETLVAFYLYLISPCFSTFQWQITLFHLSLQRAFNIHILLAICLRLPGYFNLNLTVTLAFTYRLYLHICRDLLSLESAFHFQGPYSFSYCCYSKLLGEYVLTQEKSIFFLYWRPEV